MFNTQTRPSARRQRAASATSAAAARATAIRSPAVPGIAKSAGSGLPTIADTTKAAPTVRSKWTRRRGRSAAGSVSVARRGAMYQRAASP